MTDETTLHIARAAAVSRSPSTSPENGSRLQVDASPAATVSTCAFKRSERPLPAGAHPDYVRTVLVAGLLANVLLVGEISSGLASQTSMASPRSLKARSTTSCTAPSSPVTEGTRTSSCSSRTELAAPLLHYRAIACASSSPTDASSSARGSNSATRHRTTLPARLGALPLDLIKVDN